MGTYDDVRVALSATLRNRKFWGPWMPPEMMEETDGVLMGAFNLETSAGLKGRILLESARFFNRTIRPDRVIPLKQHIQYTKEEPYVEAEFLWELAMAFGPVAERVGPDLSDWKRSLEYGSQACLVIEKAATHKDYAVGLRSRYTMMCNEVMALGTLEKSESVMRDIGLDYLIS